jgi:hypothetical protein
MTPNEKADRAREMLESDIFKTAFADIRARIVENMESSDVEDQRSHHEYVLALKALKNLRVQFQRYIDEITVNKHRDAQDEYMRKMKQSVLTGGGRGSS